MPVDQSETTPSRTGSAPLCAHAGNAFETDRTALIAAGATRGRRLRMRRQRRRPSGGAAAIALGGSGRALLVPGAATVASGGGRRPRPRPPDTCATPLVFSGETRPHLARPGHSAGMSSAGFLPPYSFPSSSHPTLRQPSPPSGIDSGASRPRRPSAGQGARSRTTPAPRAQLPDGSALMMFQGYEYPDRRVDTKHWTREARHAAAGNMISVSEWNAAAEKDAPISRPDPPLSPAQLMNVVTARVARAPSTPSRRTQGAAASSSTPAA